MTSKKCKIEWVAGQMTGLVHESWIYKPYVGKTVEAMNGQGTFRIIEVYDDKRADHKID